MGIKIIREDTFDKVDFSFRILFSSESDINDLSFVFSEFPCFTIRHKRINNTYNLILNINDLGLFNEYQSKFITFLNAQKISINLFASIVTEYDSGGFSLPETLLQVCQKTKCTVDFSFVSV